jgi:hypothetical protein
MRKHRRLINVLPTPSAIVVTPGSKQQGLKFVPVWQGFKNDAVVATVRIDATNYEPYITLQISFEGTGLAAVDRLFVPPILAAFYGKVTDVIKLFDY